MIEELSSAVKEFLKVQSNAKKIKRDIERIPKQVESQE
jgi:hypothetical protein